MLNAKQEQYVQNIVKGMSQREAYKQAYNVNYKDEAIDSKACVLFKTDKIQERYKELIKQTAKETIISVQERKELLTKIAKAEEYETYSGNDGEMYTTPPRIDTRMKALDILNKMDGEYVQKVESNVQQNISIDKATIELLNNVAERVGKNEREATDNNK